MKYKLDGLDCANCASEIENELNKLDIIDDAVVNFATKVVTFKLKEESSKNIEIVKRKILEVEPDVNILDMNDEVGEDDSRLEIVKILFSLIIFIICLYLNFNKYIELFLFIVSYLVVGYEVLIRAIKNIFKGKIFDENFLMAVATIGAFLIGEYPEAVAVMLFYQVGELFQDYAVNKSRKSISNLMDIRPDYANVCRDSVVKTNPEDVMVDEIILVKPGEKIPLDGIVVEGKSMINTLALTGEAVPRSAMIGDEVLSGSINLDSVIKVKVTKNYGESTVSKILELVENAGNRKSKSENFITKFAKVYTPVVVMIAVILAIVPPLLFDGSFSNWIYRALSFLVVSCPCALVISIPLSFFAGIGACSKIGVLVKGSNYLEKLSNCSIAVCDKTGTLTEGVFEVVDVFGDNKSDVIRYAAYAESFSNHPISISIKKYFGKDIDNKLVKSTKEISGYGVVAMIDNKEVLVGNDKLMEKYNVNYVENNNVGTIVYVAVNNKFLGSILISDKIKDDSYKVIPNLKKYGINRFVMLTGDRDNIARDISNKLGINEFYSELLPDQKVDKVEKLIKENKDNNNLIFIGDGINDAPVLAISDIGISMGGIGSDAAIEASDIVLMDDKLSKVFKAIDISKKTIGIVKENIYFAIIVKVLVLVLSACGISTMWEAVFADVGVSVIAILNSLRILLFKIKED